MSEDAQISSFLFWKLSIILATLDKIYDLLSGRYEEIEIDIDDKAYIDSARTIIKSTEISLKTVREIIESLKTTTARNYFFELYNKAKGKLELVIDLVNKK